MSTPNIEASFDFRALVKDEGVGLLEEKKLRYVRTKAGEDRFHAPIGSPILGASRALTSLEIDPKETDDDWVVVKGRSSGKTYRLSSFEGDDTEWFAQDEAQAKKGTYSFSVQGKDKDDARDKALAKLDAKEGASSKAKPKAKTEATPKKTFGDGKYRTLQGRKDRAYNRSKDISDLTYTTEDLDALDDDELRRLVYGQTDKIAMLRTDADKLGISDAEYNRLMDTFEANIRKAEVARKKRKTTSSAEDDLKEQLAAAKDGLARNYSDDMVAYKYEKEVRRLEEELRKLRGEETSRQRMNRMREMSLPQVRAEVAGMSNSELFQFRMSLPGAHAVNKPERWKKLSNNLRKVQQKR